MIDRFLAAATVPALPGRILGLLAPHAGYVYSGGVAAHSFKPLVGSTVDTVVILGPSHSADYGPYAISAYRYYETPLGLLELDEAFIAELARELPITRPTWDQEHSVEIEMPFLQRVLTLPFRIVPIMMSYPLAPGMDDTALDAVQALARVLARVAEGRSILLVASSDLSHLYSYESVVRQDRLLAELVGRFDTDGLARSLMRGECQACGGAGLITVMKTAQALGATSAHVLRYANSGDVTGNKTPGSYTVGYLSAAFCLPPDER
jgi:AmmeMemoRadiSam system protein B